MRREQEEEGETLQPPPLLRETRKKRERETPDSYTLEAAVLKKLTPDPETDPRPRERYLIPHSTLKLTSQTQI